MPPIHRRRLVHRADVYDLPEDPAEDIFGDAVDTVELVASDVPILVDVERGDEEPRDRQTTLERFTILALPTAAITATSELDVAHLSGGRLKVIEAPVTIYLGRRPHHLLLAAERHTG